MKRFDWDESKDEWLKDERNVSFDDIITALGQGRELARIDHPNTKRYANQKIIIVEIKDYAYIVPFVEDEEKIFLKTVIPSRKMTKRYLTKK